MPLGWTFAAAAVELLPTVVEYAASAATANDSFVAAPSAAGYTYPDLLPTNRVAPVAGATASLLSKSNMRLLNIIGSVPAAEPLEEIMSHDQIDAVFWYSYGDGYSGYTREGSNSARHARSLVDPRVIALHCALQIARQRRIRRREAGHWRAGEPMG